jgi:hypothetical protein
MIHLQTSNLARRIHRSFHCVAPYDCLGQSRSYKATAKNWNNKSCDKESSCSKKVETGGGYNNDQQPFWTDRMTWIQAATNTTRCLVGCSVGDLSMLFITQSYGFSMPTSMALSMTSGLTTSFALETFWLKTFNKMSLNKAAETAFNMSMISMLSMEAAENIVDLSLTGGQFAPTEPWWWVALAASLGAGFVTPLPYNYYMIRKYGKSCH